MPFSHLSGKFPVVKRGLAIERSDCLKNVGLANKEGEDHVQNT